MSTTITTHRREFQNRNAQWGRFQCMDVISGKQESGGKGLVILSDVFGMETEFTLQQPVRFIQSGVFDRVLIPDLFRNNPFPFDQFPATPQVMETWRNENALPYERIVDIALTVVEEFGRDEGISSVGMVGYCIGGGRLTEVLSQDDIPAELKAGVGFYGTRISVENVKKLKVPVLMIFAENDQLVPLDLVHSIQQEVEALPADRRGQVEIFKNRNHAFVHNGNQDDQEDSNKAMEMATNWFKVFL